MSFQKLSVIGPKLFLLSGVSLASVLLCAPNSHAGDPDDEQVRYQRDSGKARAKGDLLNTRFEQEREAVERERERGQKLIGAEQFGLNHAAVEQELADKQIGMLKKLIGATEASDPEYPDYLFRLADHYLEKKAYFELQAGTLYDPYYAALDAGDKQEAKRLKAQQERHEQAAKQAGEKAVEVYAALTSSPQLAGYKRMDEALYYLAFELGALGREQEMQAAYKQLINDHPSSPHIAQAYLAFGDYYYGKGQIGNAVKLYDRVIQFTDSPVYAYALYKLAWCHLNPIGEFDARYDKSLDFFVKTIEATKQGRAGSAANGKQLRRDARRDLVRAYVHAAKPSKAWKFFTKVGEGPDADEHDARKMMELLANQYFGDGQYAESTSIYKALQKQFPSDAEGCGWQGKIVINTLASDDKEVQWKETERLASFYQQLQASEAKTATKKQCKDNTLATMKQMATVWHDEAEKTKLTRTYELAEQAYEVLLATFPGDKDNYESQYFYAELLWALASDNYNEGSKAAKQRGLDYFLAAHEQFVKTLELDPKGKYTKDAAFAQMLAMKNFLEYDETGGKRKSCVPNSQGMCVYDEERRRPRAGEEAGGQLDAAADFPPSEYTETESQMLAAYDIYTKYVDEPDDPELPKIMFHRVKLMFDHNRFDEAKPLLIATISKFDDVEGSQIYAAWSAGMLLDMLTIQWLDQSNDHVQVLERSEELQQWATKVQGMKLWSHPESASVRTQVPKLLMAIGWRKGQAYQEAGAAYVAGEPGGDPEGFEKCATQFIDVFNTHANHDKADTLLWNAAECSDAAYRVGQAIQIRNALLENFPDSEHAKDTLHYLAESYQAVAYYDESAERYEQFAADHAKDERASDALQNAYLFRLGLGQEGKAKENLAQYESLYKKKDVAKAAKIFWSQHDLLGSATARRAHAKEYLDTYGTRGGLDRAVVAEALIAQIDWRRACDEPLLYDSCISIKRKRKLSGSEAIAEYERLAKQAAEAEAAAERGERVKFKPPKYCGSPTQGVITVHRRSKKRREAAQARFTKVLKMVQRGKIDIPEDDKQRAEDFRNAWAMAMVYQADQKYEKYLRIGLPEDLDFNVEYWREGSGVPAWERRFAEQKKRAEESKARVAKFLEDKQKLGQELRDRYEAVTKTGSPYWVLAAAARSAGVMQNFADQLYRAEVPSNFRTQEEVWAYCDTLADYAVPLEQAALGAYEYCVSRSTEYAFFNEFSRLCEEEMQQRDAEKYPATHELFGESIYTRGEIDRVGVLADPEGGRVNPVERQSQSKAQPKAQGEAQPEPAQP